MPLRFDGGERLQRGRGLGGILRAIKGVFSPLIRGIGRTAAKAIKSNTGKLVASKLKDQAIDSALSLTSDALRGNDMEQSLSSEFNKVRENAAGTLDEIKSSRKRGVSRPRVTNTKRRKTSKQVGSGLKMTGRTYMTRKPPKKSRSKKGLKRVKKSRKHFNVKRKSKRLASKKNIFSVI